MTNDELKEIEARRYDEERVCSCGKDVPKLLAAIRERDARIEKLREALKVVDGFWFDPAPPERGACMGCEANLHPNAMGKHSQHDGGPCPFQVAHEALAADGKGG